MWKQLRVILRHPLASNALSLYGVQFAKYLLPLVTIPYLTRVLGPSGWGLVAVAQAYGAYLSLPVSYGFNFSATRDVARFKEDRERLSDIFASVMGAKCLLASFCIAISFGVAYWVPVFRGKPLLLWMAVFAALVPCFTPIWYFVGLEQLKLVATLDIAARSVATAGIFVVVHHRNDAWKVLAVYGAGSSVALVAGTYLAYRELIPRLPAWGSIWEVLRAGRSMFVSSSAIGLYASGNAFILSLFAPPFVVGYYAGAEKMVRAALQLFQPPYQALFPRVSSLVHRNPARAFRLTRLSALLFGGLGLGGGIAIFFTAPWLVRIILGAGYDPAIPVVRLLAVLLPLIALNMVMGGLWLIPHKMDRAVEVTTLVAGAINIGLAVLFAPRFMGLGVAAAVVLAELFVGTAFFLYLNTKGRGFWGKAYRAAMDGSPLPKVSGSIHG
ncbi:MAG: flippase [Terriglobia bacterium]